MTVACVLRSGGDYGPEHVWALKRAVAKHLREPHEFCILTDGDFAGMWGRRLLMEWPGWWSKIELFRPGLFTGPVLYFDLDTVVVGDLSEIAAYRGPLAMLSDFYKPLLGQSGVMAWTPGPHTAFLWERFLDAPVHHMRLYPGDGQFLYAYATDQDWVVGRNPDRLQALFPGQLVSYKLAVRPTGKVPAGARVVCFHGHPRPWQTSLWGG